jgi:hypothetical protein
MVNGLARPESRWTSSESSVTLRELLSATDPCPIGLGSVVIPMPSRITYTSLRSCRRCRPLRRIVDALGDLRPLASLILFCSLIAIALGLTALVR